eukprot:SM000187S03861  [mRNA]  locus=s187:52808:57172:+ [translate_table: standard]
MAWRPSAPPPPGPFDDPAAAAAAAAGPGQLARRIELPAAWRSRSAAGGGIAQRRIWDEFRATDAATRWKSTSAESVASASIASATVEEVSQAKSGAGPGSGPPADASPQDCDEAVVGLSSAKARAQERVRAAQEAVHKGRDGGLLTKAYLMTVVALTSTWAFVLGLPAKARAVARMSRADWARTLAHWKDVVIDTLQHYWVGTKLLWADVRISSRLLLRLAKGKDLTRRERRQLTRTAADIFRLVPFAVFIIVPFMEFLLPFALRIFPNMLPSTFQDKMKEEEALKRKLKARLEYAKFLQETVGEMAKEVKARRSGDAKKTAEQLTSFLSKVRTGKRVNNEEILSFASLFNDELTLDNMSRSRLISMCKYMGLQPFGTDQYLRYMLRSKLAQIKEDDRLIKSEGVDSLTVSELQTACRERGMLGITSEERMRQQLTDWLELSLDHSVPSSLLILSRSFVVSGKIKPEEAVSATLSSLPDEVVESVGLSMPAEEDSVADRKRKLEELQAEEKLIKQEEEQQEKEQEEKQQEEDRDIALDEMRSATAAETQKLVKKAAKSKSEELCNLSSALAVLAASSSVAQERSEFLHMVNKEIQLYNQMVDKEGSDSASAAREAYKAARHESDKAAEAAAENTVSSALINRVDKMLHKLEKELDDVDAKIGDRWRILDRDYDGKVTADEVAAAASYLRKELGSEPIQELISNLAKDSDGKILVEDIVKLGVSLDKEQAKRRDDKQEL